MDERYEAEAERKTCDPVVEGFARFFGCDAGEVQSLCESVLAELKREAIIMDFLPIFAARRLRDMLRLKTTPTLA